VLAHSAWALLKASVSAVTSARLGLVLTLVSLAGVSVLLAPPPQAAIWQQMMNTPMNLAQLLIAAVPCLLLSTQKIQSKLNEVIVF
jgi:hypothetical protein